MASFLHRCKGLVPLFWLLPLGLSATPKPKDVVAEVDGFRVTVADLQRKLSDLGKSRSESKPDELKEDALNELINEYLVKIRALSVRLENDTIFMRRTDQQLSQLASRELFRRAVTAVVSVLDSEVVERFRRKPENYQLTEWLRASHILITPVKDTLLLTARQKETGWWADSEPRAKAIADSLHRLILSGASFDSLARHWSQDMVSGLKGGDLGIFSQGQMVPEFDSVAFHLKVGAFSPPVKSRFGYHLIKVTGHQEQGPARLNDSLKEVIHQQLLSEKTIDRSLKYLDSLYQIFGLAVNEKILDLPDSALLTQRIWAATSVLGDTVWSDRLGSQLAFVRPTAPRAVDRTFKMDVLKELITPFLLRQAIRDAGITESKAYLDKKEQLYQNEQVARILKEASLEYYPTPEEINEYFQQHKTEFTHADSLSVHIQQMLFKTRKEAERVMEELQGGADFILLARKYFPGDSDIAQEAFDLGFISPPAMPADFFAVAETLTIGTVSRPIKTRWGYHLIRVLGRRPDLNLEMARPKIIVAIRKAKQEEHKRKWEASLREGHVISVRERVLKSIKYNPALGGVSGRP
ncbi:MAG TPA: peptidylprolyl isomerase [candidate division Zixibacteria bacterium]|nr:peptidylprolyl isomerase [candidate division Zixibacteria bacterium]